MTSNNGDMEIWVLSHCRRWIRCEKVQLGSGNSQWTEHVELCNQEMPHHREDNIYTQHQVVINDCCHDVLVTDSLLTPTRGEKLG